jgi:serine/threonine-protein kinase RsbW
LDEPTVTLRVPPLADHVTLLRTVVSGIAARRDYTLEQVDDLRMAVEEAAVLLLRHGHGAALELLATIGDDALTVELSTDMADPASVIDPSSFSWMILQALTDDLSASVDDSRARLTMVKHDRQHDHVEHVEGRG